MSRASTGNVRRRCILMACLAGFLATSPIRADLDPNASSTYPQQGGYGIIICGNSIVFGDPDLDELIKQLLREAYLALTEQLGFDPNKVWVLVDSGNDSWTQGLFDALPATKSMIAGTFQTIGEQMWSDPETPRHLVVIIGGHGGDGYYGLESMRLQLASGMIYDFDFVADCVNQINDNAQNSSPIERLDVVATMCYSGALINDFRDNFHALRGSTWPNAKHFSMVTAGDVDDITTGFMGVQLVLAFRNNGQDVTDINEDGTLSIYEYFDHAARADLTNPTNPLYTPYVPETIYVPSDFYIPIAWDGGYLAEHPLYCEWNAPVVLDLHVINGMWGAVTLDPAPDDANAPQYALGTSVTLTAVPNEGKRFGQWEIYDPNHPDDANYSVIDTNSVLTITMDHDCQVVAVFRCGSGAEQALPLLVITAMACGAIARRMRRA